MKPSSKLKRKIILSVISGYDLDYEPITSLDTDENIDLAYEDIDKNFPSEIQEYQDEFRSGSVETNIDPEYSRHYESRSVAVEIDNEWIGWTYWYGGGKWGQPETIDWISDSYFLTCREEQVMTTVRTFSLKEENT